MDIPFWAFVTLFLSSVTALSVFLYHFVTKIENYFEDKEWHFGEFVQNLRALTRVVFVKATEWSKIAVKYISLLLEQTLLKETPDSVENDFETPVAVEQQKSQIQQDWHKPGAAPIKQVRDNFGALFHEAELLVKAIDKNEDALTLRQLKRVDMIVDSLLFLEEEYRNIPLKTQANDVARFKLHAMINDLKEIHQSTLHVWPKVSSF